MDDSRCPDCDAPIELGADACPNGHPAGSRRSPAATTSETLKTVPPLVFSSDGDERPAAGQEENTLFECVPCERLVETQYVQERTVAPRHCPWCSGPLRSIIGRELDGCRVDEVIGRGGFGLVYLASNLDKPEIKLVVKFLRPTLTYRNPEFVRVFVEEARLTEEIGQSCWNVVRVFHVREKPWPYFFMEYLRGATLEETIEKSVSRRLPLEECKGYLRGIARAIGATHAHERIHRDLKPMNIMVIEGKELAKPEDRIKLLDFGLALQIAGTNADATDGAGGNGLSKVLDQVDSPVRSAGTPEYMAPESFDGINEYAGDIYAFGVTAYDVLAGERPWQDPPLNSNRFFYWRDAHKKTPPRPIREVRSDVPGWLAEVVMRCLEKSPRKRIARAEVLEERLKEPFRWWLWLTAAAGLVLSAYGLFLVLDPPQKMPLKGWEVVQRAADGTERPRDALEASELWVRDAEHLKSLLLTATLSGEGRLTRCEARVGSRDETTDASFAAECVLRDAGRAVELRFTAESPLRDGSVLITGTGGDIEIYELLEVRVDRAPPDIDRPDLFSGRKFDASRRLRSENQLEVKIVEEHLDGKPWLAVDVGGLEDPIYGTREKGDSWLFSLSRLRPGEYRDAKVVARARAGHERSSPAFDLWIDDENELNFTDETRRSYLARERVFFEFTVGEPISRIDVFSHPSSPVPREIYRNDDFDSSLDLSLRLRLGNRLKPDQLLPGTKYLLAVRPDRVAGECRYRVEVGDTAVGANGAADPESRNIRCDLSDALLTPEVVAAVHVEVEDGRLRRLKKVSDGPPLVYGLEKVGGVPTRLATTVLRALRIKFHAEDLVHRVECPFPGMPKPEYSRSDVVYRGVRLPRDAF